MDFNKVLDLLESNFVKDALDKAITGEWDLTDQEKDKLLSLGLIDKKGKPTQKAKEQYSELFEGKGEKSWKVYVDGKDSGIVETNYDYAVKHYKEKSEKTGKKYKLVPSSGMDD